MTSLPAPLIATDAFIDSTRALGIAFEPGDLERLGSFLALLRDANTRFNLTRVSEPESMWTRHVLDSLALLPLIASTDARAIADVGSGGGLPGLPLAIVMPEARLTLIEATGKKAAFLVATARALGLRNVDVVNERAESVGRDRDHHREHYDVVVARAVGPLPTLLELTLPLARVGGLVLAIKGEKATDEIAAAQNALHRLHGTVINRHRTSTATIVVIEKRRTTPKMYPRRPGEPKRSPL